MTATSGFQPPFIPAGQMAYMIYAPRPTKSGWKPGAFPHETTCKVESWQDFAARFQTKPDVISEKGRIPSISPGVLVRDASQRRANLVQYISFLGIDLDHGGDDLKFVRRRVSELELSAVFHTTWSHMQPGKNERWRAFIELEEPIPAKDWPRFWRAAMHMLCGDADGRLRADRSCINADRVYFGPAVAPGYESTYRSERMEGSPLIIEDVWEAAPKGTASTPATASDRVAAIASHRAMLAPSRRTIGRDDLETLAKDKKRVSAEQRAAFKAAAAGTRMVVAKGEARGPVLAEARADGLFEGDVDPFLASLMYCLAIHHRDVDPAEVDAVFAQSFQILIDDDAAAGNTPYSPGALGDKFRSATRTIDDEEVARAEKSGLPTATEFEAEKGASEPVPGGVFAGRGCYFVPVAGIDGEPYFRPLSNFVLRPREQLHPIEGAPVWLVDIVMRNVTIEAVELPLKVFGGTRDFRAWANQWSQLTWDGSDAQVMGVKALVQREADENGVPSIAMTSRIGWQPEHGALVYPWGALDAQTGADRTAGPRFSREGAANDGMASRLAARPDDLADARIARAIELMSQLNRPEVMEPLLGWLMASLARPALKKPLAGFPHMVVYGSKNSGKTSMLERLVEIFGGYDKPVQSCINGLPSLVGALHGVTSIPMWLDEYKPSHLRRTHVQAILQLLREGYGDLHRSVKDGPKAMIRTVVEAPILISGEAAPSGDPAAVQRCAVVETSLAAVQPGAEGADTHRAAFAELTAMGDLSGMSVRLALFAARARWEPCLAEARRGVDDYLARRGGSVEERTRGVLTALVAGRLVWHEFAVSVGAKVAVPDLEVMCAGTLAAHTGGEDGETRSEQDPLLDYLETISTELLRLPIGSSREDYVTVVNGTHLGLVTATCWSLYHKAYQGRPRPVHDREQLKSLAGDSEYMSKGGPGTKSERSPVYRLSIGGAKPYGLKIEIAQLEELPIDTRGLLPAGSSVFGTTGVPSPETKTLN